MRTRIALAVLVVGLIGIAAVALVAYFAGGQRFNKYLTQVRHTRSAEVARTLTGTYRAPQGWDASSVYAVGRVATASNVDVAVYDLQGRLVFTVQGYSPGASPAGTPTPGATPSSAPSVAPASLRKDQFEVLSYPIVVNGRQVAVAEVYAPRAFRSSADSAYQAAIGRDVAIAAAAAALLVLVLALLLSRRLTSRLEELADVAGEVAAGNLDARVAPRGDDEVAALATAFDMMADRLARDAQWRRDTTADLSEEIRQPLSEIESRMEALQRGAVPATPENLRPVVAEVQRLGRLLSALRALNEMESEDFCLGRAPVDLVMVAREALDEAAPAARDAGLTLGADLQPAGVLGDQARLKQVIGHLIDNAVKFTPAGGSVTLSTAVSGEWGTIVVADTGPGIDPVDLPFVFDRFYRSKATRGTSGVGLGLAISRGLVEALGGEIEAADGPQAGAVFTVRLRAAG